MKEFPFTSTTFPHLFLSWSYTDCLFIKIGGADLLSLSLLCIPCFLTLALLALVEPMNGGVYFDALSFSSYEYLFSFSGHTPPFSYHHSIQATVTSGLSDSGHTRIELPSRLPPGCLCHRLRRTDRHVLYSRNRQREPEADPDHYSGAS